MLHILFSEPGLSGFHVSQHLLMHDLTDLVHGFLFGALPSHLDWTRVIINAVPGTQIVRGFDTFAVAVVVVAGRVVSACSRLDRHLCRRVRPVRELLCHQVFRT